MVDPLIACTVCMEKMQTLNTSGKAADTQHQHIKAAGGGLYPAKSRLWEPTYWISVTCWEPMDSLALPESRQPEVYPSIIAAGGEKALLSMKGGTPRPVQLLDPPEGCISVTLATLVPGMSLSSVTLASALQVRGEALSEEEIWSLLFLATEQLLEDLRNDSSDYVVCPWSALLSATGNLSFQGHVSHIEAAPFKAPELLQGQSEDEQPDASQPLQLREPLHSILLTMCEDQPHRRCTLQSVLEACRVHEKEVSVYPAPAGLHIRKLAGLVLGTISEVERRVVEESSSVQQNRSYLLRKRLHGTSSESPAAQASECLHPCRERSTETQSSPDPHWSTSTHSHCSLLVNRALSGADPQDQQEGRRLSSGSVYSAADSSWPTTPQKGFLQRRSKTKKGKSYLALRDLCVVLLNGQHLEVKCDVESTVGAVFNAVTSFAKLEELTYFGLAYMKGKEFFFLDSETRLCKIAPEGWREQPQKTSTNTFTLFLRIKFFVSHYGMLQHSLTRHQFYLQLRKDILEERLYCNEEMLLQLGVLALQAEFGNYPKEANSFTPNPNEARFSQILAAFLMSNCSQLEGNGLPRQVESKPYFHVEDYIPASLIERMTALRVQVEISEMHRLSSALWGEDAELEFLREWDTRSQQYSPSERASNAWSKRSWLWVPETHQLSDGDWRIPGEDEVGKAQGGKVTAIQVTQQLPEYGVLVHQVFSEKRRPEEQMALGICAKGVVVYEVKNNSRIATLRFQWRETGKISTYQKKFTITSSVTGKKHTFVTDSAKTSKYLLDLCSAQHGFNAQMGSGQPSHVLFELECPHWRIQTILSVCVVLQREDSDHDKFVQMANLSPAHQAQSKPLIWIQRLSCSENELFASRLQDAVGGMLSTSLDNFKVDGSKEAGAEGIGRSPCTGREQLKSACVIQKPMTWDSLSGPPVQSVHAGSQNNRRKSFTAEPGREIVRVTLKRDPHRGFGFVINEGEYAGQADPGIFISSIIPGGPAEKAKMIKPGGQILALNHISLEGFTFNMAVRMIQNSPDNIELIISQSKGVCGNNPDEEKNSTANSGVSSTDILSFGYQGSLLSRTQDQDRNIEELDMAGVKSLVPRLRHQLSFLPLKGTGSSCPPSPPEISAGEIYFVELVKEDGTLGFSVTGGINTSVPYGGIYVKSIVPGGPAAKEGQILQGDRLLQVDGLSLCGLTHKQAVQCLKGPGQIARLVLERRGPRTTQQCPSANDSMGDEHTAVSLVTALPGRPSSCVSVTDGPKFEVKLKKNANGLGFSFVQMEKESCSHLKSDLVRIKRLFPGQPAEENGAIEAGDIILAVNGRSTEGLIFQEVLHLLRGAPQEVTLLLCRPPPGALPEMEQEWQSSLWHELFEHWLSLTGLRCGEYSKRQGEESLPPEESPESGSEWEDLEEPVDLEYGALRSIFLAVHKEAQPPQMIELEPQRTVVGQLIKRVDI
ncbi:PDZ domain-containing protein 5C [Macaca fascicularis]|uniref:PDZ domain-containing protein 5C n=1 Tax=Macaca fascicularis TaxID=9541 RepID=G7PEU5_MACFA|nr:PDZ domain-containing protein 5C [Macaca fascicularis]